LIVLWVSVAAGGLFFATTRGFVAEIRREKTALDMVSAEAAARAGIEKARYLLATLQPAADSPDALSALDAGESFIGTDVDGGYYFLVKETEGESLPALGLVDQASRLNLNTATQAEIEALPNMTPDLAAAIIDFRDSDDTPLAYGAESTYYLGLPQPYRAKNADYENLAELMLVRGMTPAVLYGEDRNLNGILDANENDGAALFPLDNADGALDRGLYPFVTVASASPVRPAGDEWVDLNTGSPADIAGVLVGRVSRDGIFRVMRTIYPQGISGGRRSLASLGDLVKTFPDFAEGALKEDLATVFKYCTVSEDTVVKGLVNVNTAPQEVLRTLPSVDDSIATAIAAERDAGGHDFSTVCWLLDVPGVTPEIFADLVPLVSARSTLYTADCIGTSPNGAATSRIWATVDTSTPQMTVVSSQVVSCGGKALDFKAIQEAGWLGK
jgi:DNA uptake protein ComE-like DNA-binding protein